MIIESHRSSNLSRYRVLVDTRIHSGKSQLKFTRGVSKRQRAVKAVWTGFTRDANDHDKSDGKGNGVEV